MPRGFHTVATESPQHLVAEQGRPCHTPATTNGVRRFPSCVSVGRGGLWGNLTGSSRGQRTAPARSRPFQPSAATALMCVPHASLSLWVTSSVRNPSAETSSPHEQSPITPTVPSKLTTCDVMLISRCLSASAPNYAPRSARLRWLFYAGCR